MTLFGNQFNYYLRSIIYWHVVHLIIRLFSNFRESTKRSRKRPMLEEKISKSRRWYILGKIIQYPVFNPFAIRSSPWKLRDRWKTTQPPPPFEPKQIFLARLREVLWTMTVSLSNDARRHRQSCCAVAIRVGGATSVRAFRRPDTLQSMSVLRSLQTPFKSHSHPHSRAFCLKNVENQSVWSCTILWEGSWNVYAPRHRNNMWDIVRYRYDFIYCSFHCSSNTMMLSRQATTRSAPSTSRTATADAPEPT